MKQRTRTALYGRLAVITALTVVETTLFAGTGARAQTLTADDIAREIVGQTMVSRRMGMTMRTTFAPDGRLLLRSIVMNASGTWRLNGDQLCIDVQARGRSRKSCATLERAGKGAYRTGEGRIMRRQ